MSYGVVHKVFAGRARVVEGNTLGKNVVLPLAPELGHNIFP